jgi:hydroxyacylglutathione hydrolase
VLFERIEDKGLAQFSYIVGCEGAGAVAVVDPRRDVDVYLEFARTRRLRITHVLETHIHADFASGGVELAAAAGAELAVSAYDRGEQYETAFAHRALTHGETIEIGRVRLQALHTPGHTPEHLSFLVFDTARSSAQPMILLSGDFLFVGSLGRPDLLGDEAKRALAVKLYRSVRDVLGPLPDGLEIAPGHGAGSMCGAGMSGRATSTLGFERIANPYLRADLDEETFVAQILSRVPPFPDYYRRMKALNAQGARELNGLPGLQPLTLAQFDAAVRAGQLVIDLRDQVSFGEGHVRGSFGIGAGTNLSTWASWVVPYDAPLVLVSARPEEVEEASRSLIRVGLDDVRGFIGDALEGWTSSGRPVATTPQLTPLELARKLANGARPVVIDVRGADEWDAGRIAGARHIMAGELAARIDEVPSEGEVVLICGSGYRSTVAASVLERAGRSNVSSVTGGMTAWKAAALPVVRD